MKKLLWLVVIALSLAGTAPFVAYWIGMENAVGRPVVPQIHYAQKDALAVWQMRKEALPISLRPISTWHWYELIWCSLDDDQPGDFLTCGTSYPGLRASGFVAKEYLIKNMKRSGLIWRYLSRAAITVWITKNWSKDDLVAELVRLGRLGR